MGQRLTRRFLLGALALAALAGSGCDRKALRFNNTLTEYNRQLFQGGRKLGEAMSPAVQGWEVDPNQVRNAYDELVSTLDAVKKDFATLPVPKSASGQRYAAGYTKFLKGQNDMIRNDVGKIVRHMQRNPKDRMLGLQIITSFRAMQKREQESIRELQKLQEDFCREHNLPLMPGSP
jgi:hypothetical protein